jgi:hypothetical protein
VQRTTARTASLGAAGRSTSRMVLDNRPSRPVPKSVHVMAGRLGLGAKLKKEGKIQEARAMVEDVVEGYTQLLGSSHSHTLTAKLSLGNLLRSAGEGARARRLYEEVIKDGGQEDKLKAMMSLASLLKLEAGEVDEEAAAKCRGDMCVLGASCTNCERNDTLEASRKLMAKVVADRIEELGPDHADTLRSKMNLAALLHSIGDRAAARTLYTEVIAGRSANASEGNPAGHGSSVLQPKMNLAILLDEVGEVGEARVLYAEAATGFAKEFGPAHADTLGAKMSLAALVDEASRDGGEPGGAAKARALYGEAIEGYGESLGLGHPETLQAKLSLGEMIACILATCVH